MQPALNSFNSVLFDGKFLCTHSSGPIAQFCFPTNQPNMRCNPWILCGSQLAKDRPWPGDENGARCHLSKANCRSAAFRAGAPSSSPFGTNGAVHTSTTSVEYTYSNAIRMQAQIQIQTFPTLSYSYEVLTEGSGWETQRVASLSSKDNAGQSWTHRLDFICIRTMMSVSSFWLSLQSTCHCQQGARGQNQNCLC